MASPRTSRSPTEGKCSSSVSAGIITEARARDRASRTAYQATAASDQIRTATRTVGLGQSSATGRPPAGTHARTRTRNGKEAFAYALTHRVAASPDRAAAPGVALGVGAVMSEVSAPVVPMVKHMRVERVTYRLLAWAVLASGGAMVMVGAAGYTSVPVGGVPPAVTAPVVDPAAARQAVIDQVTSHVVAAAVTLNAANGAVTLTRRTELVTRAQERLSAASVLLSLALPGVPDATRQQAEALLAATVRAVRTTAACQVARPAALCRDANRVATQVEQARAAGAAVAALRSYGSLSEADVAALVGLEQARLAVLPRSRPDVP